VRLGDKEAIDALIVENQGLVVALVNKMVQRRQSYGYLFDDLCGVGFLALTEACHALAGSQPKDDENVSGYLAVAIDRALRDSLGVAGCSARTQAKYRREGRDDELPPPMSSLGPKDDVGADPEPLRILRDEIEHACLDSTDREIVRLREMEYSINEVAEQLDLKSGVIRRRLKDIAGRMSDES
jgi:RNA polymerase sigma factor (sigma-70 family)